MLDSLQIGRYKAVVNRSDRGYIFTLYDTINRRYNVVSASIRINISDSGEGEFRNFELGERAATAKTAFALDVLRYFIEDFLYKKRLTKISGTTNLKLAKAMEKRGWKISKDSAAAFVSGGVDVSKILSSRDNQKPFVYMRIHRKKRSSPKSTIRKPRLHKR